MLNKCNVVRRKNINIFKTREQLAKEYNLSMFWIYHKYNYV